MRTEHRLSRPIEDCKQWKYPATFRYRCHRSQWRSTMDVDPDASDRDDAIARFRARVADAARSDDGTLVERYRLLTDL